MHELTQPIMAVVDTAAPPMQKKMKPSEMVPVSGAAATEAQIHTIAGVERPSAPRQSPKQFDPYIKILFSGINSPISV